MKSTAENRRLKAIKGASKNLAKRYRLPAKAMEMLDQAGVVHGQ